MNAQNFDPSSVRIVAVLTRGPAAAAVRRALRDEGMNVDVRDRDAGDNVWRDARSGDAVLVDDGMEPASLMEALGRGWIHGTAPVFVVAARLPARERYLAWLDAGAWDVLKIPLEITALALRLRNILGEGRAEERSRAKRPYSLEALEQAAEETLALSQRYEREFHCAAVAVEWPDSNESHELPEPQGEPVIQRLAEAAQGLVRRSDLIGISDARTLLVLLPETDESSAAEFLARLVDTLEDRLEEWGVLAQLKARAVAATEAESGRELLSLVARRLDSTPP